MHAGSNDGEVYTGYHFTNVLKDARKDATNLFDVASKDNGTCIAQDLGRPESGGIITYNEKWAVYTDNWESARGSETDVGGCLEGDGHHFCSRGRTGARFNNAGGTNDKHAPLEGYCGGSLYDTVFWVWGESRDPNEDDNYGCGGVSRIDGSTLPLFGTGCQRYNGENRFKEGQKPANMPMFRYNFMLLY